MLQSDRRFSRRDRGRPRISSGDVDDQHDETLLRTALAEGCRSSPSTSSNPLSQNNLLNPHEYPSKRSLPPQPLYPTRQSSHIRTVNPPGRGGIPPSSGSTGSCS